MRNRVVFSLAVLILALLCCPCATLSGTAAAPAQSVSDALRLYRNSSLVVVGDCVAIHKDADGEQCYDLSITEVVAGNANAGDTIHLTQGTMKLDESYLLYLAASADVYHTEDMTGYTLLTDSPLSIADGRVSFEGATLSLSEIRSAFAAQENVITAPSEVYYYDGVSALANAAEEIFIGRINVISDSEDVSFRSTLGGSSVENTLSASMINVTAYGSIKGSLKYGDEIELVWCPSLSESMTNAATLQTVVCDEKELASPVRDGVYLFFLISNPDDKQTYYFGVNPVQAMSGLDTADQLHSSPANAALSGYNSLSLLVEDLKNALES